ncbi:MerR family transcriptional regulator [Dichotomicrobium thermohalophilum]|uniref:MerR-like DNA binding protein n=1 Tax=Dichotomicrobium thermohalophilum TaxID=933063 RepID=A0A397Q5V9_9HYPH|nr:MerR family transcriptional regulator [Dichotomicrobium thermohalophilum]RIA56343.1 MerR-like DNA binding protein [Dichotomicrobium thermohalophilum]
MGKSPEAFRTISEVSAELDVPKHVLRFWETKFAQVKPMKRGGNRRYYRPEDVELLRGIRTLLHDEGYTIRGLQRVLRQHGVNYVKNYCRTAASDDTTRAKSALPDLAGETAGHARQAALQRAKAPAKRRSRDAGADGNEAKGTDGEGLSPSQRRSLESALNELEQCRQLLAGAQRAAPAA